jgi:hypothetical protein
MEQVRAHRAMILNLIEDVRDARAHQAKFAQPREGSQRVGNGRPRCINLADHSQKRARAASARLLGRRSISRGFIARPCLRAMVQSPFGHRSHDGLERLAQGRQSIFRSRRDYCVFFSRNDAPGLQLLQLLRQNAVTDRRTRSAQIREAQIIVARQRPDNARLPFAAHDLGRIGDGTLRGMFHGSSTNKKIRSCAKLAPRAFHTQVFPRAPSARDDRRNS